MPMVIITYWLWIDLIFQKVRNFELPLSGEKDFTSLADYALEFKTMMEVSCYTLALLFLKMMIGLQYSFPSFQLLFKQLDNCKYEMLYFYIIFSAIVTSFAHAIFMLFYHKDALKTFTDAFFLLVQIFWGTVNNGFTNVADTGSVGGMLLVLTYTFLTFFFLRLLFVSIILISYREFRQKFEKLMEAQV